MNKDVLKKAGKLVVAGFEGLSPGGQARFCARELCIGNWIFFSRNVESPGQLRDLVTDLGQLTLENSGFTPLMTMDQEGGIVSRLHGDLNHYPGAMAAAASGSDGPVRTAGIMASHLRQMGINVNLAPVGDINSNPANPVIGPRSYGDDPGEVGRIVLSVMQAHREQGIIPVVKHFPGHGDTATDSHLSLPVLRHSLKELENRELIPFRAAVNQGAPAIMAGHMAVPALDDSGKPASLSKKIIGGYLRKTMGFKGLVMTDCMEMKGIQNSYSTEEALLLALDAGADLFFLSHSPVEQEKGVKALYDAILKGRIPESRLDASISRMEKCRREICQPETGNTVFSGTWPREDLEELEQVSRRSLTLIKDEGGSTIPLKDDPKLLILHYRRPEQFIGENTLSGGEAVNLLTKAFPLARYRCIKPEVIDEELQARPLQPEKWNRILLLCSDLFPHSRALTHAQRVCAAPLPVTVAIMRTPYEAAWLKQAQTLILCYEDTPLAYRSLRDFLLGEFSPSGCCPVRLPGLEEFQDEF